MHKTQLNHPWPSTYIVHYGSETCTTKTKNKPGITAAEMKLMRRTTQKHRGERNQQIKDVSYKDKKNVDYRKKWTI